MSEGRKDHGCAGAIGLLLIAPLAAFAIINAMTWAERITKRLDALDGHKTEFTWKDGWK